jgi:hypothetical protein
MRPLCRNPSRLILGQRFGCRAPTGLIFEINVGRLLAGGVVAHDEASEVVFGRPWWGSDEGLPIIIWGPVVPDIVSLIVWLTGGSRAASR